MFRSPYAATRRSARLARNFFITADQEQTAAEVAAAQQSILDRQRDEGKVGAAKYLQLSSEKAPEGNLWGWFVR